MGAGGQCGPVGNSKNNNNKYNDTTSFNKNITLDINDIKKKVSNINIKINNANLPQMKSDIDFIKSELSEIKNLLILIKNNQSIQITSNANSNLIPSIELKSNLNVNKEKIKNLDIVNNNNENLIEISLKKNNNNINKPISNIINEIKNNINDNSNSSDEIIEKNEKNTNVIFNNNNKFKKKDISIKPKENKSEINIKKPTNEKTGIISMNGKDEIIKINQIITLVQFKSLVKNHFFINDNTIIFYYNKYGVKKLIQSEIDFKKFLLEKILKCYFSNEIMDNKLQYNYNILYPNIEINPPKNTNPIPLKGNNLNNKKQINKENPPIQKFDNNNINNIPPIIFDNFNNPQNKKIPNIILSNQPLYENKNNAPSFNNNNTNNNNNKLNDNNFEIGIIQPNNFLKKYEPVIDDIDKYKKEVEGVTNHFASLAFVPGNIDKGDFINSAAYLSHMIKNINIIEKQKYPNKFHDFKTIVKSPGLISSAFGDNEKLFILSLIADVLEQKGINVSIYKKNEGANKLDGASLQYLFNGFTEKKKYEIHFDLEPKKNNILLQKGDELNVFIEEWKTKI